MRTSTDKVKGKYQIKIQENLRVKLLIVEFLLVLEDKALLVFAVMQTRDRRETGGHMHELILSCSHSGPFSEPLNKDTSEMKRVPL